MTKYINEPNHLRLKPEGVEKPDMTDDHYFDFDDMDPFDLSQYGKDLGRYEAAIASQPTFLKVGDGWERFKEGEEIDGGEVEIVENVQVRSGAVVNTASTTNYEYITVARLKHMEAGEESEVILCAAIWYLDIPLKKEISSTLLRPVNIDQGVVFCGYRHPHCMYTMVAVTGLRSVEIADDAVGRQKQGFLTSKNRFVDRQEAAIIFYKTTGKLPKYSSTELYSEDLY